MATGDLEYYEQRLAQEIERAASAPEAYLRSVHATYARLLQARIDALCGADAPHSAAGERASAMVLRTPSAGGA